jgi:hypothetical protein
MPARLGKFLMTLALLGALGGHWAALQGFAWTTMMADQLRTRSFGEAFTKTLDGRHPCPLCKQIAAGKQAEKKAEFPAAAKKLDFIGSDAVVVLCAPRPCRFAPESQFRPRDLARTPPTPPPRAA